MLIFLLKLKKQFLRINWLFALFVSLLPSVLLAEDLSLFKEDKKFSQIEYKNSSKDFGAVLDGEVLVADFTFKNIGTSPLNIIDIITDCACSTTDLSSKKVLVGETLSFKLNFNTAGFTGRQSKSVVVVTDSLEDSHAKFTVNAKVVPELDINPSSLSLLNADTKDIEKSYRFNLKLAASSQAEIEDIFPANKKINLTNLELLDKSASFDLVFLEKKSNSFKSRIIVKLRNAKRDSYSIPVRFKKQQLIKAEPPVVSFGVVEDGNIVSNQFKIENFSETGLEITNIEVGHPAIKLENIEENPHTYQVNLDSNLINKSLNSSITLQTNNPDYPEVIVSVIAILPPNLQ